MVIIDQGGYHFRNLGDWAMLKVALQRLVTVAEVNVVAAERDVAQGALDNASAIAIGDRASYFQPGSLFGPFGRRSKKLENLLLDSMNSMVIHAACFKSKLLGRNYRGMQEVFSKYSQSALCVSSGGGYLTDEFPEMVDAHYQHYKLAQKYNKPYYMMSQGIGPLEDSGNRAKVTEILNYALRINLRESGLSLETARSLGCSDEKIRVTGDDAVAFARPFAQASTGERLGLNVRVAWYSNISGMGKTLIAQGLKLFREGCKDAVIQPLPVSFYGDPPGNDYLSIYELCILSSWLPALDMELRTPEDLAVAVSHCRLVVTGSYHAAVFALAQGIPALCVASSPYYVGKFEGLRGMFGEGCVVWHLNDNSDASQLASLVGNLWANAANFRHDLLTAADRQVQLCDVAYQELYAELNGSTN